MSDKDAEFFTLVSTGDAVDAVRMMEEGQDVNAVDPNNDNWSGLHYCAYHNRGDLIKHLCYNKADVNQVDAHGNAPLHIAAYRGSVVAAGTLMQNKADVNIVNKHGYSALHYAAGSRNANLIRQLIDKKADANVQDNDGWTALHWAAYKGSLEGVRMLLKKDASPDVQDNEGLCPLDIAVLTKQGSLLTQSLNRVTAFKLKPGGEKPSARVESRTIVSPRDLELRAQRLASVQDHMKLLKERLTQFEEIAAQLENKGAEDEEGYVFLVGDPNSDGSMNFLVESSKNPEAFVYRLLIDNANVKLMDKVETKRRFEAALRVQDILDAVPASKRLRQAHAPSVWWYAVGYKEAKSALETAIHDQDPPVDPDIDFPVSKRNILVKF